MIYKIENPRNIISQVFVFQCVTSYIKMYSRPWKLYTVIASLILSWSNGVPIDGISDTDTDSLILPKINTSSEHEIILNADNETRVLSLGALFFNNSIGSIHINNIPSYANPIIKNTQSKTLSSNVRDDYTLTEGNGYYKLHKRKLSWNDARKACIDERAHLAVINSLREEEILLQLMKNNGNIEDAYIGVHNWFEETDWMTITGESLEAAGYTTWTSKWSNVPDNRGGHQNCAALRIEGGMDDVTCRYPRAFICEVPLSITRCTNDEL